MKGIILWFDKRDGQGVIKGIDGRRYYTDVSAIAGRKSLSAGMLVSFIKNDLIKDTLCAKDVVIVED